MRSGLAAGVAIFATIFVLASCTSITGVGDLSTGPQLLGGENAEADSGASTTSSSSSSSSSSSGSSSSSSSSSSSGSDDDASTDVIIDAAPPAVPLEDVFYQCVPLATDQTSGLILDSTAWPGFRFEITGSKPVTTTSIAVQATVNTPGKIFGAIVKLNSAGDSPDANNLSSSDVLKTAAIDLPANPTLTSKLYSAPIVVTLSPGFYAAVFGAGGAFGSTATASATVPAQSGAGGCTNSLGYPFTITQGPTGMFGLQATTPHMIVRGTRPK